MRTLHEMITCRSFETKPTVLSPIDAIIIIKASFISILNRFKVKPITIILKTIDVLQLSTNIKHNLTKTHFG
ncbi:hypothetical protein BLOT_012370 [Blomia tropicalis]|nr:hypothetical protein BLOT_012370 [Blomia tropicalis]